MFNTTTALFLLAGVIFSPLGCPIQIQQGSDDTNVELRITDVGKSFTVFADKIEVNGEMVKIESNGIVAEISKYNFMMLVNIATIQLPYVDSKPTPKEIHVLGRLITNPDEAVIEILGQNIVIERESIDRLRITGINNKIQKT